MCVIKAKGAIGPLTGPNCTAEGGRIGCQCRTPTLADRPGRMLRYCIAVMAVNGTNSPDSGRTLGGRKCDAVVSRRKHVLADLA